MPAMEVANGASAAVAWAAHYAAAQAAHEMKLSSVSNHLQQATPPSPSVFNNTASPAILDTAAAYAAMTASVGSDELQQYSQNNNITNGATGQNGPAYTVEYLSQLLKDKKQLQAFPNVFHHLERLADEEIGRVRIALFQFEFTTKDTMTLPDADGDAQVMTEKVFVPAKEHPDYNFVGRILGPRGMTAKQLETETGCKIMVRGRGSMRDKKKEELNRGKPNWEHLSEELHVLIQCEDTPNRARVKLARAKDEVNKLLVPAPEGEDELKRKQLMELAIINGTYRSASEQAAIAAATQLAAKQQPLAAALQAAALAQARGCGMLGGAPAIARSPTLGMAGAPIVMSPNGRSQQSVATSAAQMMSLQSQLGQAAQNQHNAAVAAQQAAIFEQQQLQQYHLQQLMSQGLSYEALTGAAVQYQPQVSAYAGAALQNQLYADYAGVDLTAAQSAGGAMLNQRRVLGSSREHPYKQ